MGHYLKNTKAKRVSSMAQVVQCLPSKLKVLSSKPSTMKKEEKKEVSSSAFLRNAV
jgi:hypothetical protein